ncbi:MAG: hypothetical protein LUE21_02665 [Oscillospiraceae bacterium]|nr:hypothetical protein [Oscillospiraceae bacterium]
MIFGIVALVIGILVLAIGVYFLRTEKDDPESRKIYTVASVLGAVVAVIGVVRLILSLL